MYIHTYMYMCIYMYTYTCIQIYTVCTCIVHLIILAFICVYIYIYICTYIYIHMQKPHWPYPCRGTPSGFSEPCSADGRRKNAEPDICHFPGNPRVAGCDQ